MKTTKTWVQKYREAMRLWALLWRRTGHADDLKFAISARKHAHGWAGIKPQ